MLLYRRWGGILLNHNDRTYIHNFIPYYPWLGLPGMVMPSWARYLPILLVDLSTN